MVEINCSLCAGRHALEELEEKGAVLVSVTDLAKAVDEKGSQPQQPQVSTLQAHEA